MNEWASFDANSWRFSNLLHTTMCKRIIGSGGISGWQGGSVLDMMDV